MEHVTHDQRDMKHHHEKSKQHLYQFVQVEMNDGSVYQGILHSYDMDKLFLIMPKMHHHMSMELDESSSRQFPFFGPFGLFGFPFFGIRRFGPFFPFFI
ncbi:hypothetical protein KHA93_01700 [Bacillus sp. FJAT-49732]|uniref:Uncharacterized protein n=1 Tax=Lederbergia citrisecunda TaxID=2833583 RepID=A0A942TM08_9BACI|nr:hypothetical protein [Lederbergia citrisecunda]MBS4198374.1 hypothetical protein [Lederbergia citrisecunda]